MSAGEGDTGDGQFRPDDGAATTAVRRAGLIAVGFS